MHLWAKIHLKKNDILANFRWILGIFCRLNKIIILESVKFNIVWSRINL